MKIMHRITVLTFVKQKYSRGSKWFRKVAGSTEYLHLHVYRQHSEELQL